MAVKAKKEEDVAAQQEMSVFDMSHEEPLLTKEEAPAPTPAPEQPAVEQKMYSEESVLKMMEKFASKLRTEFNDKVAMLSGKVEKESSKQYVDDLSDDWLETPATFFTFAFGVSIHGDRKRGVLTTPPNGAIKFKPILRSKKKGRHGPQVISVSSIRVHSKREAEYLRGHSWFGIKFFESVSEAITVDTTWAQKLVEANQSVQSLSDQQIIARCQMENLYIGTDTDTMRKQLVELIAKRNIRRAEEINIGKIKNSMTGVGEDGVRRVIEERKIAD